MELAGVILDLYDDPNGLVLRKAFSSGLPAKYASSEVLSVEQLDALPDHLFGLVATNHGHVVRKFAMHDEPHIVTSVAYFLERGNMLPADVRQKVANNLIEGCRWYDLSPPKSLLKLAVAGLVGKAMTALGAIDTVGQTRGALADSAQAGAQRMNLLRMGQAGAKLAGTGSVVPLSDSQASAMQRGEGADHIFSRLESKSDTKEADLNNTEIMSHQTPRPMHLKSPAKLGGWCHCGDITHERVPVTEKKASYHRFALLHRREYPIDTAELVQKAASYFDEHLTEFPALERRLFAKSVTERADELGVKVAGAVLDYGGEGYGPHIEVQLHKRADAFEGTGRESAYWLLLEKHSSLDPAVMVELIKQVDAETGADRSYGRPSTGFLDPYASVYGHAKVAADESKADKFSWQSPSGDYVTGWMLEALAMRAVDFDNLFGKGFGVSFAKDPIGIFSSMPDPQKVVMSRLASDNSGQTFRI